jgi:hypothetical protein
LIALAAIASLVAFVALVLASQLPAPAWLWALDIVAFSVAVAVMAAAGEILTRAKLPETLRPLALPVLSAIAALGLRRWLLDWLSPSEAVPRIDYGRLQLAAFSLAAAGAALLSASAALSRGGSWPQLLAAGLVLTAALYAAGPALIRSGLPLDMRAFLGLAGLGVGAYALVEGARRAGRSRDR